jgi:hypothetical protein
MFGAAHHPISRCSSRLRIALRTILFTVLLHQDFLLSPQEKAALVSAALCLEKVVASFAAAE